MRRSPADPVPSGALVPDSLVPGGVPPSDADPPPGTDSSSAGEPVLLVTRDQALADHVRALADAAAAPLVVRAAAPPGARAAPLALIGLDVAADLPPGRHGGVLIARVDGADPPDGLWRRAVEMGAERVALLPEAEPWLIEALMDAATPSARAPVIGVLPGSGGAGASTLAVALAAVAARRGSRVVLVDADPLGGGLDLALGLDAIPGLRWPQVPNGPGRWPAGLVRTALPEVDGVSVLTCARDEPVPLRPVAVGRAVDAAARECDLVVVDLARHIGEVEADLLPRFECVLLVIAAEVRAVAAAAATAAAVTVLAGDVRLVVRTRSPGGPAPEDVADVLSLPLAGRVGADPNLAAAMERGETTSATRRGPLVELCGDLLAEILLPW